MVPPPFPLRSKALHGNFYGTTSCGGVQTCINGGEAGGTVYQLTSTGLLTTLHQFDCSVGCSSYAPLVQGTDGNFYGTTTQPSSSNFGSIFKVTPSGTTFKTLKQFDGTDGWFPTAPLIQASDGDFYGTTELGGANGYGVVFKMTPGGKLTVLHSFADNGIDGYEPVAGLVQATDGNLYGVTEGGGTSTYGTIFSISPKGTGYSNPPLYSFDGTTTGLIPEVALLQHTNGLLYGLTDGGGPFDYGVFYSFDMGLKPFVSLVSTSGAAGSAIGILGQGFSSSSIVKFGGVQASTIVLTGTTLITATVPSGAKTGAVTVKTKGSPTLKSNKKFRVSPVTHQFRPAERPGGNIRRNHWSQPYSDPKVTFGGVKATAFTKNSDTQLTATVPVDAETGSIVVTSPGGTATSSGTFTVTP